LCAIASRNRFARGCLSRTSALLQKGGYPVANKKRRHKAGVFFKPTAIAY